MDKIKQLIETILEDQEPTVIRLGKPKDPALSEFMKEFWEVTYDHPFDRQARVLSNSVITLKPFDGSIHISDIMSITPNTGGGTEAIKFICELADKHQVKLTLIAKKYGERKPSLSTKQLAEWYGRYGFTKVRGSVKSGIDMIRVPQ